MNAWDSPELLAADYLCRDETCTLMRTISEKNHFLAAFRFAGTFVVRLDSSIRRFFFAQVPQSDIFRHWRSIQLFFKISCKIRSYSLSRLVFLAKRLETLVKLVCSVFE